MSPRIILKSLLTASRQVPCFLEKPPLTPAPPAPSAHQAPQGPHWLKPELPKAGSSRPVSAPAPPALHSACQCPGWTRPPCPRRWGQGACCSSPHPLTSLSGSCTFWPRGKRRTSRTRMHSSDTGHKIRAQLGEPESLAGGSRVHALEAGGVAPGRGLCVTPSVRGLDWPHVKGSAALRPARECSWPVKSHTARWQNKAHEGRA